MNIFLCFTFKFPLVEFLDEINEGNVSGLAGNGQVVLVSPGGDDSGDEEDDFELNHLTCHQLMEPVEISDDSASGEEDSDDAAEPPFSLQRNGGARGRSQLSSGSHGRQSICFLSVNLLGEHG